MPKINVYEQDLTKSGSEYSSNRLVLVVGGAECSTVELFEDTTAFKAKVAKPESNDVGYIMALTLLKEGMQVLYTSDLDTHKEDLKDKSLYDMRFLISSNAEDDIKLKEISAARQDCIAILSATGAYTDVAEEFKTGKWEDKFAAAFAPEIKIPCKQFDKELGLTGDFVTFPAGFGYLLAFATSTKHNPTWFAVAGNARGRSGYSMEPTYKYGTAAIDLFQSRDSGKVNINPICNIRPFGNIIWGNRTLCPVGNSGSDLQDDLVASNFLNVTNLVIDIKKKVYEACRKLTFEQNTDTLWSRFTAEIEPLLDSMVSGNGIEGYKLSKKEADVKAKMVATIRIVPIEAVEDFDITVEMGDAIEVVEA